MTGLATVASVMAVLLGLGVGMLGSLFGLGSKPTSRSLLELGTLEVPRRLEDRSPEGSPERVRFLFDRVENSFSLMGSHTPISERLVVFAVAPDVAGAVREELIRDAIYLTQERTGDLVWESEGSLRIGRGIHRVNTHETPAWVSFGEAQPGIHVGYMVWEKHADLARARRTFTEITGSFRPSVPLGEFFEIERARPETLRGPATRSGRDLSLGGGGLGCDGPAVRALSEIPRFADLLPAMDAHMARGALVRAE